MADVTITITIPSAYVSRLQDAVVNGVDCQEKVVTPTEMPILDAEGQPTGETKMVDVVTYKTLNPKVCLIRNIKSSLKQIVKTYERQLAEKTAVQSYNTTYKTWSDTYEELTVDGV